MSTNGIVVLNRDGGPPPHYRWTVFILDRALDEANKILTDDQYAYISEQVRELARQADPTHVDHLSVDTVEGFHELREKGGVLGNKNIRVYFSLHPKHGQILLILGVRKKEADGATPVAIKVTMGRRMRLWVESQVAQAKEGSGARKEQ
jgi:hypothetical protein